ncbi:MAG: alpha/beta hydrolase [Lachnospiraceae bacterium]|nr:alpha/beta hydrolase [Lachnospiraceae bacterium]
MTDEIGNVYKDISYGDGEANKFDLYVPADGDKESYGLVVYLHAGGFTSGDKAGDAEMLTWLCSRGYVAAGINYTLRSDENDKSVYSQSTEIKEAMPKVVEEAEKLGYHIDKMAIAGGSAGGTLAMLYAYRDAKDSPVPVKMMFEAVGPSSFYRADWDVYGLNRDTDESRKAAAGLFGVMLGTEIDVDILDTPEYDERIKPISAFMWIDENSVPSVIAYGAHDRVCPFRTAAHLVNALEENGVDYRYFEMPHSGHGLQNDDKMYEQYMSAVEEYLNRYMPVE